MPINNGGGASGITIELDPNSLPLTGGTLTGNLILDANTKLNVLGSDNWDVKIEDGFIEGWRTDPNSNPFNSYQLAVDGNSSSFSNWSDDDGSHWDRTMITGASIYLYTYEGLLSSSLTKNSLVFTKNIDGVEEEIPPYTRTTTISVDGGISYNGDNGNNDHNFTLNESSVYGEAGSDNNWGLGSSGAGGSPNGGENNWGIGVGYSGGNYVNELWWHTGFGGIEIGKVDDVTNPQLYYNNNTASLTVQTDEPIEGYDYTRISSSTVTPSGMAIHIRQESEDSANLSISIASITKTGNLGGNYSISGDGITIEDKGITLGNDGLVFANPDDVDYPTKYSLNGIRFPDRSVQETAFIPQSVGASELSQSGNIAHSDYPLEIVLIINGTPYAIPAREFV